MDRYFLNFLGRVSNRAKEPFILSFLGFIFKEVVDTKMDGLWEVHPSTQSQTKATISGWGEKMQ